MNNLELIKIFQENNYLYEVVVANMCRHFDNIGVFIDCGAHTGQHSENMLINPKCKSLIAIEAIPELASIVNHKIHNSLANVQILNIAVGNGTGEIRFSVANDAMGYSGVVKRENLPVQDWREIIVQLDKLDNIVSDINNVAFIKLDLEGGEFNALLGCEQILLTSSPFFVFENSLKEASIQYSYSVADFFNYMEKINYSIYDFFGNKVNSSYWDDDLQTYMFCGVPNNSNITTCTSHLEFIQMCVYKALGDNQK